MINTIEGEFVLPHKDIAKKWQEIKALVFDWDGVFNNGIKNPSIPSPFAEADSMGTNLLRYEFWRRNQVLPVVAIITGADNPSAIALARRERFQAVYSKILDKGEAIRHLCEMQGLQMHEVACFFDDANDLAMAKICGLRILVQRKASPLFTQFVKNHQLCDYITKNEGGQYAIRETCEMLMAVNGVYQDVLLSRYLLDDQYKTYFAQRQQENTRFFKTLEGNIQQVS